MTGYQGKKFHFFLKKNNISTDTAAKKLNKNKVTVYQYFKSENLSREVVKNILNAFQTTENEIWGDVIPYPKKEPKFIDTPPSKPRREAVVVGLHDPEGLEATGDRIYELPDGTKIMEVRIIPIKAQAGFLSGYPDPEYFEDLPTLKIIAPYYAKGLFLAFEAEGDSMTPDKPEDLPYAVLDGWYVVGREVPRHLWRSKLHTHLTSKWVIVHKTEGILIKQITKHHVEEGKITVHSLNPRYKDQDLNLDDVELIFSVIRTEIKDT